MIYKFTIPGKLPSLNEYTGVNRKNRYAGAKLKAELMEFIAFHARAQLGGAEITRPVRMYYKFVEENKRRDWDNVVSVAVKVIQDTLVSCGVLRGDGQKWVTGFYPMYGVDKNCPRIEVVIEEV